MVVEKFKRTFTNLVHETGFVIRHSRLHTTGVIAQDVSSSKIKECLERNFLVEGIDYNLLAVNGHRVNGSFFYVQITLVK